ncbi:MAG: site-2 protease family protein [bacterium]
MVSLLITLPVILIAITVHEFAHAKVADILGDPTPRMAGRLTLNPIAHIDPIGLLMLVVVRFGWAKPVPINHRNFADPVKGSMYVSLAGPLSNFFLAWVLSIVFKAVPVAYGSIIYSVLSYGIWINLALGVFNLLPIPPLDGSHILEGLLPYQYLDWFYKMQQYSFLILIMVIMFASPILIGIVSFLYRLLV